MPENLMIPSVDLRIGSLEEYNRRQRERAFSQHKKLKVRDHFTRDFLSQDDHDPALYQLLLNNDRITPIGNAHTVADFVCAGYGERRI